MSWAFFDSDVFRPTQSIRNNPVLTSFVQMFWTVSEASMYLSIVSPYSSMECFSLSYSTRNFSKSIERM